MVKKSLVELRISYQDGRPKSIVSDNYDYDYDCPIEITVMPKDKFVKGIAPELCITHTIDGYGIEEQHNEKIQGIGFNTFFIEPELIAIHKDLY